MTRNTDCLRTHNDPESEVKDGCESSKNVPDDIDKDITDVIGSMEVMTTKLNTTMNTTKQS